MNHAQPMATALRQMLGDRYDDVIDKAMAAPKFYATRQYTTLDRVADTLAAVLPDLLAEAWYEGAASALHGQTTILQGGVTFTTTATPNPYRIEETR